MFIVLDVLIAAVEYHFRSRDNNMKDQEASLQNRSILAFSGFDEEED